MLSRKSPYRINFHVSLCGCIIKMGDLTLFEQVPKQSRKHATIRSLELATALVDKFHEILDNDPLDVPINKLELTFYLSSQVADLIQGREQSMVASPLINKFKQKCERYCKCTVKGV